MCVRNTAKVARDWTLLSSLKKATCRKFGEGLKQRSVCVVCACVWLMVWWLFIVPWWCCGFECGVEVEGKDQRLLKSPGRMISKRHIIARIGLREPWAIRELASN